ncbi:MULTISPECIES: uroporphyrinogen-III C-methyltransferase [Streptomyces]|uniref:Uroporphyrinogen-III C-methyltransferase n=5 Tax=Streptomyces TaxID=1883 RepID=A0ABD5E499_9ACTN|nr:MULTISPECIES: uroporphyrinogen-III C-methyltransferase [unclassified Streptomyces]ASY35869.1 uroporphyrinogen-III C-methyltransferase [Streptomyces sp. CLI2509]MDT0410563.1 uroporphyrinogen-III C-methyltransferase [Streptomyces sp. DSM 41979]MDT0415642.1 uroporphyrinogen-III C-methyltransferase [Streptomyces sp. DSM 41982]MYQ56697.1 uroporphyrinogen-III C-methyltransferase [Streptomyces sp. SID4926]SCD68747.1 uroporphyrinogen-III C-methyltransferase [Streptomyces sp. DfronAA-171]
MPSPATHPAYPAGLRLAGRKVVVLGGGQVAQRRLPALLTAGADVLLVSPSATASVEAMATAGELRWERRPYRAGDLEGAWYAIVATDDADANDAASAEAEERRVWCVRSDDADAASAWTPASGHSAGVTVAVLTTEPAERDPRRTAAVRDSLLRALDEGRVAVPRQAGGESPRVALVGGGPGDPDLITVRGRRLLAEADVVIADRLGPRDLLAELPPHVEVIDAAKIPYGRAMAQEAINEALITHAKEGKTVVRLKGGDPFVFGRGMEEAQALAAAGIPCTVVPGISSSVSVPAAAGIPVTHRGVAHEFTVVSGHVAPDDPRSLVDWPALARLRGTLVILMGVDKLGAIAEALVRHGRDPETPVALIQEGTTAAQRRVDARLETAAETARAHDVRPPAVIVVGAVAALGA